MKTVNKSFTKIVRSKNISGSESEIYYLGNSKRENDCEVETFRRTEFAPHAGVLGNPQEPHHQNAHV